MRPSRCPWGRGATAATLLGVVVAASPLVARADEGFTISASKVTAPTGLTADQQRGVYWTVNQTGAALYALTESGKLDYTVTWGATDVDIQAVSASRGQVYVGDIGDPDASRSHIVVMRPTSVGAEGTSNYRAWDFVYPDGAHDAKAMAVSPKGNIYIITTGDDPGIYRAPASLSTSTNNTLKRVADAPAGVTDATFLADGARIAMRTYTGLYVYDAYSFDELATAELPAQGGGESLALSLDSKNLLVGDKSANAAVAAVEIPTTRVTLAPAPSAPPSATASPTPTQDVTPASPTPTVAATPTASTSVTPVATSSALDAVTSDTGSDATRNRGTLIALGAAVAAAAIAGIVAAVRR